MTDKRPDRVLIYRDAEGRWRWHKRDGHNNNIESDSGQGYESLPYAIDRAFENNPEGVVVIGPDGQEIDRPSETSA